MLRYGSGVVSRAGADRPVTTQPGLTGGLLRVTAGPSNERGRQLRRPYFFASPSNLPVFRLMKCSLVQAGQTIPSYSFSEISGSPSNWCWTLRLVAGHLKTKWAIGQDMTALRTRP